MLPPVKTTKFTDKTDDLLKKLSNRINIDKIKASFKRLHKENIFNIRFSGVLDAFSDFQTTAERLEKNIERSIKVGREIYSEIYKEDEMDQELRRKAHNLTKQNKADLRHLYVNAKIFLDEYTGLLRFIFNWRDIGDRSITRFYNSLNKYNGSDKDILSFKESCIEKLKAIDVYITKYRDDKIIHNQQKHKQETEWFRNEMDGRIRFIGGDRPSLTSQEIAFVVMQYIECSQKFCLKWLDSNTSNI